MIKLILLVVLGLAALGGIVGGATCACSDSETVDTPDAGPPVAPGVLHGVVVTHDTSGREVPAAGARIQLDGSPFVVAADESGAFELPSMRAGDWSVTITLAGAARRVGGIQLTAAADGTVAAFDLGRIVLEATGSLSGVVRRGGAPVPNARVVLDRVGEQASGDDGSYDFTGLVAGLHRVAIVGRDGTRLAPLATVSAGGNAVLDLDLDAMELVTTGAVEGRVVAPAGASALVLRAGTESVPVAVDGTFLLNLAAGVQTLQVSGTGIRSTSLPFVVVAGGRSLGDLFALADGVTCANGGRLVGTLEDQDSDAVADATEPAGCLCLAGAVDEDADGLCDSVDRDLDADGRDDLDDNCVGLPNADQADLDADGLGDACDADVDGDGLDDESDNCPLVANADQADLNADLEGDACDPDDDGDGIDDTTDNCPVDANVDQADQDADLQGDACDLDDDGDGLDDSADNCPLVANVDQADLDADLIGDVCDPDVDGDDTDDVDDNCLLDANPEQHDLDGDGFGDACDDDDDGDRIDDALDNCPIVANEDQLDSDLDGQGDLCDGDVDGDEIEDLLDNCPVLANADQANFDADLLGDACDPDDDDDGIDDADDNCALAANADQADLDADLIGDACDADDDGDGIDDTEDNCPLVANEGQEDLDEDTVGDACDADVDGDGIDDTDDNCPLAANADQLDTDEDGIGDACEPAADPCVGAWCLETPLPAGFSWQRAAATATDVWLATSGAASHFDGTAWTFVSSPSNADVADLVVADNVWLATEDGALLSSNGGTFTVVDDTLADSYLALHVLDDDTLLAAVGDGTGDLVLHDATGARRESGFTTSDVLDLDGPAAAPWAITSSAIWQRLDGVWTELADVPFEADDALVTLWTDGTNAIAAGSTATGDVAMFHFDGTAWIRHVVPFATPHALDAADGDHAWLVLDDGALLAWDGTSWQFEALPGETLRALAVVSATDAWSVGDAGRVERHDGTSWTNVSGQQRFAAVYAIGGAASDLWFGGTGGALLRFDGTTLAPVAAPTSLAPLAIEGTGTDLWLLSKRSVLHHFDGSAWNLVELPISASLSVLEVAPGFVLLGGDGVLLRGDGASWEDDSSSFIDLRVTSTLALSGTKLYAATVDASDVSAIARFDGTTWTTEALPDATTPIVSIAEDDGVVWALARDGRLFERATDGTWTESMQLASTSMVGLARTSATTAVAIDAAGKLFDWDGTTWTAGTRVANGPVAALWASGDEVVVAGREIRRRVAGTWSTLQTGPADPPRVLAARADDDVWLAGRSDDVRFFDGTTWTNRPIPAFCTVSALVSTASNEAFAACGRDVWHWSTDAWTSEHTAAADLIDLVAQPGTDELFATTMAGLVLHREDGTWAEESTGLTLSAWRLAAGTSVWLLGDEGLLARRVDGAWNLVEHEFATAPNRLLVVTEGTDEVLYVGFTGGVVERFAADTWTEDRAAGGGDVVALTGDGTDVRVLLRHAGPARIERRTAGVWTAEEGPALSSATLLTQVPGGDAWSAGTGLIWRWRAP